MLVLLALRKEAIKLFTVYGFNIMMYCLCNFYIDTYIGTKGWSWNDFFTIVLIIFEILIHKIKKTYGKN